MEDNKYYCENENLNSDNSCRCKEQCSDCEWIENL